ncbi:MAG: single-stranded DNA-binding protein [Clostridia bacterium]|nr:single-stranded DNA-binding protein [Clostridia bacterium]
MSLNLNKVILAGRIVADPELKQTPSGVSVVSFRIAVNRRFASRDTNQPETDFFNVTAWRQTAEFVSKYFHKGSAICIVGSIQNRTYTDQQGQKRTWTDIIADEANFVESRANGDNAGIGYTAPAQDPYAAPAFSSPAASAPKFEEIKTDDDLPF